MSLRLKLAAVATPLVVLGNTALAEQASGDDIRALLSGNTLQGASSYGPYAEYYDPDGALRGDGYDGKWKVEGDKACMDYGEGFQCWDGVIKGNANIWILDGEAHAAGFMFPGNPKEF